MTSQSSGKLSRLENGDQRSRKKKNALIHGVYGVDDILPWESRDDLEKLFADLVAELRPAGRMEVETVLDIAHSRWQKVRARKMWHIAAHKDAFVADLIRSGKKSYSGIRKYLRRKAKNSGAIFDTLNDFVAEVVKNTKDRGGIEQATMQLQGMIRLAEEKLAPMLKALEKGAENTLQRAYSPENLEPILRLEAGFDARVDKLLARLASLKEFKRIEAAKNNPLLSLPPLSSRRRDNDND